MAFSLYDATIVQLKCTLTALDDILAVAEKQPNAKDLPQARLHKDMNPLTFQVYAAARFSMLILARLSEKDYPVLQDDLTSFEDMRVRVAKTIETLATADKDTVNRLGDEVRPTEVPSAGTMDISGKAFAMGGTLPNVDFHVSMTYAILRKEGVPLGKKDFAMAFANEHILKPQQ